MCPTKLNTSSSDKQPLLPVIRHRGNLVLQIAWEGQRRGARLHGRNIKNSRPLFWKTVALWMLPVWLTPLMVLIWPMLKQRVIQAIFVIWFLVTAIFHITWQKLGLRMYFARCVDGSSVIYRPPLSSATCMNNRKLLPANKSRLFSEWVGLSTQGFTNARRNKELPMKVVAFILLLHHLPIFCNKEYDFLGNANTIMYLKQSTINQKKLQKSTKKRSKCNIFKRKHCVRCHLCQVDLLKRRSGRIE